MKIQILNKDSKKGFKLLAGINRPVIPSHVTKLAKSLEIMGCIRPVVIAYLSFIDNKLTPYIIDGQHLFHALLRNSMDIPYVVIEIKDKKELIEKIALLNASSKSWMLLDYITAWGCINKDYKRLNELYNTYDFELSLLADLLSGSTSNKTATRKLKDGTFKIVEEKENLKICDYLTDILKIVPRMNRYENKYVCSEFVKFYKNNIKAYEHLSFIRRLKPKAKTFVLATQEEGKVQEMFKKLI